MRRVVAATYSDTHSAHRGLPPLSAKTGRGLLDTDGDTSGPRSFSIAEIVALKPTHTATEVGNKFGITRYAVIGIWYRAKAPPLSPAEISRRNVRAQKAWWA